MVVRNVLTRYYMQSASADFSILLPEFVKVESVFSPVLIANITDRTGNLYAPLCSKFKVITNSSETKKLYLKANTVEVFTKEEQDLIIAECPNHY